MPDFLSNIREYRRAFEMIIQAVNAGIISEEDAREQIRQLNEQYGVK